MFSSKSDEKSLCLLFSSKILRDIKCTFASTSSTSSTSSWSSLTDFYKMLLKELIFLYCWFTKNEVTKSNARLLLNKILVYSQGRSRDFLKKGGHIVKQRVLTKLSCRPPRRVLLNVIKIGPTKGWGGRKGGRVYEHSRTPSP